MTLFSIKRIVVTGCCGTIGRALLRILSARPEMGEVLAMDNNESGLFAMEHDLPSSKVQYAFGDVRDEKRLCELFAGMDVVLHTAALKHAAPCEFSPSEAIRAASRNAKRTVLFVRILNALNLLTAELANLAYVGRCLLGTCLPLKTTTNL